MIIIPDSNILISALINVTGKEFRILTQSPQIEFKAPSYLIEEILSKQDKINRVRLNKHIDPENTLSVLLQHISISNSKKMPGKIIYNAKELVSDIDIKDVLFMEFVLYFNGMLWTGDLKLLRGLKRKGFTKIITTNDLESIIKGL